MAKRESFESSNRKLEKLYYQQIEDQQKLDKKDTDYIIPVTLTPSRIKQPKTLFDSGWVSHASGDTFSITNLSFNRWTSDQRLDGFYHPLEFMFEKELSIREELLPFVKPQLLLKHNPDHKARGAVMVSPNVKEYDSLSMIRIESDSETVFLGTNLGGQSYSAVLAETSTSVKTAPYVSRNVNVRDSGDDSSQGSLVRAIAYQYKNLISGAYCEDSNFVNASHSISPSLPKGGAYGQVNIFNESRVEMIAFFSGSLFSVTGKGIKRTTSWEVDLDDEGKLVKKTFQLTSVTQNHRHTIVTDMSGNEITSTVNGHFHEVIGGAVQPAPDGHTHTNLGEVELTRHKGASGKTAQGVTATANMTDFDDLFYSSSLLPSRATGDNVDNYFDFTDNARFWLESSYNTRIRFSGGDLIVPVSTDYVGTPRYPYSTITVSSGRKDDLIDFYETLPTEEPTWAGDPFLSQFWYNWTKVDNDKFRLHCRGIIQFDSGATINDPFNQGSETIYTVDGSNVFNETSDENNLDSFDRYYAKDFNADLRVIISLIQPFYYQENKHFDR